MRLTLVALAVLLLGSLGASRADDALASQEPVLAYVQSGDIWIKALPDGSPRQVTRNKHSHSPRWSADGQWLAYRDGYQIRIARRDGTTAAVLGGIATIGAALSPATALGSGAAATSLAWSPVTDTLAFVDGGGLHVASAPEWRGRELAANAGGAVWSPDGTALTYMHTAGSGAGSPPRQEMIWRTLADGTGSRRLFDVGSPPQEGVLFAGWVGDHLLFWPHPDFSNSILADGVPFDGLSATNGVPPGGQPARLAPTMLAYPDFLAVAPAGQTLAITQGDGRFSWSDKRIAVLNLVSRTDTALTSPSIAAVQPAWSPDGRHIAYVVGPDAGNVGGGEPARAALARRRIWIMRRDGSDQRPLTGDPRYRDERPRFSDNGSHLLFARMDANRQASIWLMRADGSELTEVVDGLTLGNLDSSDPSANWFGYYGHLAWDDAFDWWPGVPAQLPNAGGGGAARGQIPSSLLLGLPGGVAVVGLLARRRYVLRSRRTAAR